MTTNGFPEGDVLRDSLAAWQDRERELLKRNTELVEENRKMNTTISACAIDILKLSTQLADAKYVEQKALEFGARQEKRAEEAEADLIAQANAGIYMRDRLRALEGAAREVVGQLKRHYVNDHHISPTVELLMDIEKRLAEVLEAKT